MKNKKILLIFLFALGIVGCGGTTEITLQKKNTNITVDGKLSDWDTRSFESYFDDKVRLKALYDDDYIYLGGECLDRQIGRRFALNGIVIWIDPEAIKDKNLEVNVKYKGERKFDFTKGNFFASLNEEERNRALKELDKINDAVLVVDKKNMLSKVYPDSDTSAFAGEMLIEGDKLTFEFKIPRHISRFYSEYKDISLNESQLGISYGQFSGRRNMPVMRPETSTGEGGERPGGMYPGGGGYGRMGRGNMGSSNNEDSEIWVKLNASDK